MKFLTSQNYKKCGEIDSLGKKEPGFGFYYWLKITQFRNTFY